MYKCNDCDFVFNEPKEFTEWSEFWGNVAPTTYCGCPKCGGSYDDVCDDEDEECEEAA